MTRTHTRYGWVPDVPDHRDHLYAAPVAHLVAQPPAIDLRPGCPLVYDQSELGSCHDAITEVLTRAGWKLFADVLPDDVLATVDPVTKELLYERPTRLVQFPYKGTMIRGSHRFLDFLVTPDHKMVVRAWDQQNTTLAQDYEFRNASELGWYSGLLSRVKWAGSEVSSTHVLPGVDHKHRPQREDLEVPMVAWLRFLGLYLAEGTMLRDERSKYKIQIAASKPREREFAITTLRSIGIDPCDLPDRFTFENRRIYESMEALGLRGVLAPAKFVPAFVFEQSADNIREFLLGHFMGDGSEDNNGMRSHYTSSQRLADDLQRLVFLSGNESYVSSREPRESTMNDGRKVIGRHPEYRVSVCQRRMSSIDRAEHITEEQYDGEVFCAEVPTHHTLVTRRKGKILISGNCTGNAIAGAVEFDLKKQGLPDFAPSRLFIYYNERAMEGTVNEDAGAQIRDGIKCVAKYGDAPEHLWPYDIAKFRDKPPQTVYAQARQHKAVLYQRVAQSLSQMKGCLASGYPFVFGFSVYESFESDEVAKTGVAPMPSTSEQQLGGHAALCVGYDDAQQRFLIRNSWGPDWGMDGYFTLPYAYLLTPDLSDDSWVIRSVQ